MTGLTRWGRGVAVLGVVLAAGCADEAEAVRVDGSAGVMPLVAKLAEAYRRSQPSAEVELGDGMGSGARLEALAEERIDVALASHGLDPEEISARNFSVHEIARGAVVFAVHAGVPVGGLTEAQICDVYRGTVTNWSELGGPDLAIVPHARPESEVDAEVVLEEVDCWKELQPAAGVRVVADPSEMLRAIADTPGAIGMTSMTLVQQSQGRARALALDGREPSAENVASGDYDLTRRYFLVTRAATSDAVSGFLEFIRSPAGAEVIRANGAVPTP